ncbi:MAG: hypothetical protein CL902_01205 [Dehalococcoidia bacterium]|nr:hypothetical protein [Dehalococcoidia bacterium]
MSPVVNLFLSAIPRRYNETINVLLAFCGRIIKRKIKLGWAGERVLDADFHFCTAKSVALQ